MRVLKKDDFYNTFFFDGNCVNTTATIIKMQPTYSRIPNISPSIIAPDITLKSDSEESKIDVTVGFAPF